MAIILTLTAIIWSDANPGQYRNGLNAFVLGLLWLKVLAFLKIVNKQMSTFIYAVSLALSSRRDQYGSPPSADPSRRVPFLYAANADTV
jgi:hypothetical protein